MARKAKIELDTSDVDKINKSLEQVNQKLDDVTENAKDSNKSLKAMEKTTAGIKKGFNAIGIAIKAAGIGLVLKAMDLLFDVVKQNQTVMDNMAVVFETISIVFNELVTAVIDTINRVGQLTGGFDATKRIVVNLINIALAPLKLTFYAIQLAVQEAQLIWEKSFFGDGDPDTIKELNKSIDETKQNIIDTGKGVIESGKAIGTDFMEAVGEIKTLATVGIEEISKVSVTAAYETAQTNVALAKSANIAAAEQGKLMKLYMREAEIQRQIRDDVSISIQERIDANNKLNDILNKQEETMLKQADLILKSAQAQYDKNKSDENYIALLEAQTNKLDILEDIEGKRSEQKVNEVALNKELLQLTQSQIDADTQLALNKKRFAAEQEETELGRLEALRLVLEQEKLIEMERLQNVIDSQAEGTQARIDAQNEYNKRMQELGQEEVKNTRAIEKAKMQARANTATASLNAAGALFGALGQLSEDNFEQQKKFQIAEAVTSTLTGAIAAFMGGVATIPGPFGLVLGGVLAAATLVAGYVNVKKIRETKPESASASGGGFSGGGTNIPNTASPSFSLVSPPTSDGQAVSDSINQSNSNMEPTKAYVVSEDVQTTAALDRNIELNATT